MRYANVVSKTYCLPAQKLDLAYRDFFTTLDQANIQITSLPFLVSSELPNDWVAVKMHITIKDPVLNLPQGMHFDSYFSIEPMASLAIYGEDIEEKTREGYERLGTFLEEQGLRAITPIFNIMRGDEALTYVILKLGYAENPVEVGDDV
jgi:effector-binding domain-containing protein